MLLSDYERRFSYKLRNRKRHRFVLVLVITLILITALAATIIAKLEPLAEEIAMSSVTDTVTIAVNEVITEKVADGTIKYSDLVTLEKDDNGNITALVTNMANINTLQAEITTAVAERFMDTSKTVVTIPLGNVIGSPILSGKGPEISVKILSVSNVTTCLKNEFTSAGINQTRHQILMDVNVSVGILLAGRATYWDNVLTEITVAETIIVGNIPSSYANLG
jgi:sporulation protein YunB